MLAFADGMFSLKIPAVASSHHKTDLPIAGATAAAGLTRWVFGCLASIILSNMDQVGTVSFALLGSAIYLMVIVLPSILDDQIYIQQLVFYRGNTDLPVSFIVAFFMPWALALLVH